jgi:hypothetical protein
MFATIIARQPRQQQSTQNEVDAILARDKQQRESQQDPEDFFGYAVVDARKTEKEDAKKLGYAGPQSEWHVLFSYRDHLLDVWTTKNEGYKTRRLERDDNIPAFCYHAEFKFNPDYEMKMKKEWKQS